MPMPSKKPSRDKLIVLSTSLFKLQDLASKELAYCHSLDYFDIILTILFFF